MDMEEIYDEILERCNIERTVERRDEPGTEESTEGGIGEGIRFERIRRITGYLVGDISRWNDAKSSELSDRTVNN